MSKKIITLFLSVSILFSVFMPQSAVASEDMPGIVFVNQTFEDNLLPYFTKLGAVECAIINDSGNKKLKVSSQKGAQTLVYTDVVSPEIYLCNEFAVDISLKINTLEGAGYIGLFDIKNHTGSWTSGSCINADKTISYGGKEIGKWQSGKEFRYSAIYNVKNNTINIYLDKVLAYQGKAYGLNPQSFRVFDCQNRQGDGVADFYVDNIRVYTGNKIYDNFQSDENSSVFAEDGLGKLLLGSARAYTVEGDYYFKDGARKTYQEAERPQIKNGTVYVSESLLLSAEGIGTTSYGMDVWVNNTLKFTLNSTVASVNGEKVEIEAAPYKSGGKVYLPARELCTLLGGYSYFDDRGFFVISENPVTFSDGDVITDMFEAADIIYRFLCFDNPSGEEMLADFKNGKYAAVHPRILMTESDARYIKEKINSGDEKWAESYANLIEEADAILKISDSTYPAVCTGEVKNRAARACQEDVECLSYAYLLTGEEKYAEKAGIFIKNLCQWTSLEAEYSNLTTGHFSMALAIVYDSFYNYFNKTDSGKEILSMIKEAAVRLTFCDTERAYKGINTVSRWVTITDNFQGVINGGVTALTLALADEEDLKEDIEYLFENLMKSQQLAVSLYQGDGGYFEGFYYSEYLLSNFSIALDAMLNCFGTDYKIGKASGFSKTGDFFLYMQGMENVMNFHDCARSITNTFLPCFFAYRFGEVKTAKVHMKQLSLRGVTPSIKALFYFDKAVEKYGDVSTDDMPYDRYFNIAGAGSFRNSFSDKTPTFAAFHGGRTGIAHDMLDLGEFIFESDGVPWVIDLGNDSYSLPNYFRAEGYRIYRKRPEGENCVVINPQNLYDNNTEYYGQSIGAEAQLTRFESENKGAIAVLDLTDAYKRDTSSYKRGYLFGDERNTFTVQDEIELKSTSEAYFFMHTPAEITVIDKNSAIFSYMGKKLRAEVFCSADEYELLAMDAKPLPTSPEVSGQNPNVGIKKLAVHTENAEGKLVFSVRLVPISDGFTPSDFEYRDIDLWSIDEGEIKTEHKLYDVNVTDDNRLFCSVQITDNTSKISFVLEGKEIHTLTPETAGNTEGIYLGYVSDGRHNLKARFSSEDGVMVSQCVFDTAEYTTYNFYENTLNGFSGNKITNAADGWDFSKVGEGESKYDYYTLTSSGHRCIDFRTNNAEKALSESVIDAECDIMFSSLDGYFVIECKNKAFKFFMESVKIFDNGKIYGTGEAYKANTWYHVKLSVNCALKTVSVFVDDEAIFSNQYIENADSATCFKMAYDSGSVVNRVSFKNFSVNRRVCTDNSDRAMITQNGYDINTRYQYKSNAVNNVNMAVAVYGEDDSLLDISIHKKSGSDLITDSTKTDYRAKYIKVISFTNSLKPISDKIILILE